MIEQHAAGQDEQRDVERHGLAPVGKDRVLRHQRGGGLLAVGRQADGGEPVLPVDLDRHDAGALAEHEERLAAADDRVEVLALPLDAAFGRRDDAEAVVERSEHVARAHRGALGGAVEQFAQRPPASRPSGPSASASAVPTSPAASARMARALRSTSSCWASSDSVRTAATTIRKTMISAGMERRSNGSAASSRL